MISLNVSVDDGRRGVSSVKYLKSTAISCDSFEILSYFINCFSFGFWQEHVHYQPEKSRDGNESNKGIGLKVLLGRG